MGIHDNYGKKLIARIAGVDFKSKGDSVYVNYNYGKPARIDGTIGNAIAIEIESRTSKQIRGAVMDLIFHEYSKKLLIILPKHAYNPTNTAKQCEFIFSKCQKKDDFRVVVTKGSGTKEYIKEDTEIILKALRELGYRQSHVP